MSEPATKLVYKINEYPGKNPTKTVFFFCPFGTPSWQLALPGMPIWHLNRAGFSVISYGYGSELGTESLEKTLVNFTAIGEDVDRRISKLDESIEVSCFGASMGTVMATNAAARHPRIKKLILNLSYGIISDHVVAMPVLPGLSEKQRLAYIDSAGGETAMRAALDKYSPALLVPQLGGKKVLLYLSRTDKVLKYPHTIKLREALKSNGIEHVIYENRRGGHTVALFYNYLRYTRYMRFLKAE